VNGGGGGIYQLLEILYPKFIVKSLKNNAQGQTHTSTNLGLIVAHFLCTYIDK